MRTCYPCGREKIEAAVTFGLECRSGRAPELLGTCSLGGLRRQFSKTASHDRKVARTASRGLLEARVDQFIGLHRNVSAQVPEPLHRSLGVEHLARAVPSGQLPIDRRAQKEGIRSSIDNAHRGLLRCKESWRPLDAWLSLTESAGLTEIDQGRVPRGTHEDIPGLEISMGISKLMKMMKAVCNQGKLLEEFVRCRWRRFVEGDAIDKIQKQGHFGGPDDLSISEKLPRRSDCWMIDFGTNFVLTLDLR